MCFHTVRIKANKRVFRSGIDKEILYVPCGHCYECVQERVNEWFVRLSSLYTQFKDKGFPVFFLTVSYNNDEIPRYKDVIPEHLREHDFPKIAENVFCFNKKHVIQFIKDLRSYVGKDLKYFCVTEYGTDDEGTHRSHYHFILFSPRAIPNFTFLNLCEFAWSHSLKKSETPEHVVKFFSSVQVESHLKDYKLFRYYDKSTKKVYFATQQGACKRYFVCRGFCMYSKDHGAQLASLSGVKYVLKYLHKETELLCPAHANINKLRSWYRDTDAEDPSLVKLRECVRYSLPFTNQSKGIGATLVADLAQLSLSDLVKKKRNGLAFAEDDGKLHSYKIPKYVLRKLFYNKVYLDDDKPVYELNKLGADVVKMTFDDTLKKMSEMLSVAFAPEYYTLIPDVYKRCEDKFKHSLFDLVDFYRNVTSVRSDIIALYHYVYRDVSTYLVSLDWISQLNYHLLYDVGKNLFFYKCDNYFVCPNTDDEMLLDFHGVIGHPVHEYNGFRGMPSVIRFNDLQQFENFDLLIDVSNWIRGEISQLISDDKIESDLVIKVVKNIVQH